MTSTRTHRSYLPATNGTLSPTAPISSSSRNAYLPPTGYASTSAYNYSRTNGTGSIANGVNGVNGDRATRNRLRKEDRRDRGGNVLPPGSGTGYGQTNKEGVVSNGIEKGGVAPRIQATVQYAKERRQQRKERKNLDGVMRGNMPIDENGVAHDSEYVQFRTATPVHVHSQRHQSGTFRNDDDDSASESSQSTSSSTENSGQSRFGPAPYSYQSTRQTSSSTHHYSSTPLRSTVSAIPGYLAPQPHRISLDNRGSALAVPRAPSPRRSSGDYNPSVYRMATRSAAESIHSNYSTTGRSALGAPMGKNRAISSIDGTLRQPTTSSYQPPAPAFTSRPPEFDPTSELSVTARAVSSAGARSVSESIARLSLNESVSTADGGSGNGYNSFAKREASTRPPQLDGSALEAGTYGMKRSWDGFKLEVKFGTHKVGKKLSRKLTNSLGV